MLVQILRVNGVAFTCEINLMLLFQVVVEGAGYAFTSQTGNQIGADPAIFQNDWFSISNAAPLEIERRRSSLQTAGFASVTQAMLCAFRPQAEYTGLVGTTSRRTNSREACQLL